MYMHSATTRKVHIITTESPILVSIMNKPTWSVVKFALENLVEAVPTNWLQGNQCYWPNYNEKIIPQAIMNREEPVKGEWRLYEISFFRNNIFDDYDLAKKKARKATYTSDLESDVALPIKRKRIMKRYSSVSSTEEETTILPPPPILKNTHQKKLQHNFIETEHITVTENVRNTELFEDQELPASSTLQSFASEINQEVLVKGQINDPNVNGSILLFDYLLFIYITELLIKIMRKLNIHNGLLTNILEKINLIEARMNDIKAPITNEEADSIFTKFDFPIDTFNILEDVEQYLSDERKFQKALNEISRLGGMTPYDFIARCLTKLITNMMASQFSYFGRKNKRRFNKLHMNSLILKAGLCGFKQSTQVEFEKEIAKWLQRAKERKN